MIVCAASTGRLAFFAASCAIRRSSLPGSTCSVTPRYSTCWSHSRGSRRSSQLMPDPTLSRSPTSTVLVATTSSRLCGSAISKAVTGVPQ